MATEKLQHPGPPPANVQIILLASDDTFVHTYASLADMVADTDVRPDNAEVPPFGVGFFNPDGRRLDPVFDAEWRLQNLVASGPADPEYVQRRLVAVVRNGADYLKNNENVWADDGFATLDEALAELPRIEGESLANSLVLLGLSPTAQAAASRVQNLVGGAEDSGTFWHNIWHAAGGKH